MTDTEAGLDGQPETLAERRARQEIEGKKAMAEYRDGRAAIDQRTAQLRALRLDTAAREQKKGSGAKVRRRSGQEIAEEAGLFSMGPPVKFRVGI